MVAYASLPRSSGGDPEIKAILGYSVRLFKKKKKRMQISKCMSGIYRYLYPLHI